MAAISSQVFSQQMIAEGQQTANRNTSDASPLIPIPNATSVTDNSVDTQKTLTEIEAIQQAILKEDFDFTKLEAPAAGNQEAALQTTSEKSLSSPVLLEDDGLLIEFRSSGNLNSTLPDNLSSGNLLNNTPTLNANNFDELSSANNPNIPSDIAGASPISGFVSEDFLTRTQGQLDTELTISAQTIQTLYGTFNLNTEGQWSYQLGNSSPEIQSLAAGQTLTDSISLTTTTGETIDLFIGIQGNNDQAVITGQKTAIIQAVAVAELQTELPGISGKLNVSDIDNGEASFLASSTLSGNFGNAEINELGEWRYTLNNHSEAVQGLRTGDKLIDLFSVKTLDGTKQLIQITIEGTDDTPLLGGNNLGILDLETQTSSSGSLTINDPDFGESSFQEASGIQSTLGYGFGSINSQGEWQFNLDTTFTSANPISEGETRVDSFDVFTADGTSQTINIPILGSDQPLFAQSNESSSLSFDQLMSDADALDSMNSASHNPHSQELTEQYVESILTASYSNELTVQLSQLHTNDIGLV